MKTSAKWLTGSLIAVLSLGGGTWFWLNQASANEFTVATPKILQENGIEIKTFELTAKTQKLTLKKGAKQEVWTYGGTVPGTQIRVTEGDRVRIVLKNDLPEATSIHWHGLPVPNAMDGVPGQTQNAVRPGESFTYEFTATTPGTYWYHSHQKSAEQVDKGLYGTVVIEPKTQDVKYDRDITLVFDEWMTTLDTGKMDHSQHGGNNSASMDHSQHGGNSSGSMDHSPHGSSNTDASHDDMMKDMYNVFTVNGSAADRIKPLEAKKGERVKLRLVNAGFQSHLIHLHDQPFKVTHTDGQPIKGGSELTDNIIVIAPGERYELEFTAYSSFWIDDHSDSKAASDIRIPVEIDGKSRTYAMIQRDFPKFNLSTYGTKQPLPQHTYTAEYRWELNNKKDQSGEEVFTINGNIHPNIPPIQVKKGDFIKLTFQNVGTSDHPMHLHGHFFQVLTRNGQPLNEALTKDTLNVRPGETYEIAFRADNEGNWMFHCHDLHHAAAGMMTELRYDGYRPSFTPDNSGLNQPE
jgi:FtsP/CotA-like multicopper oxidase with cupredoxin domain